MDGNTLKYVVCVNLFDVNPMSGENNEIQNTPTPD